MPRWCVYILRCADGTLYTGISTDLAARLATHNAGKGARYTRSRLPVRLAWKKECATESVARKREAAIKRLTRQEKQLLISNPMIKKRGSKWVVLSEKTGRSFGTYATKAEATKRLQQVEYFKHLGAAKKKS